MPLSLPPNVSNPLNVRVLTACRESLLLLILCNNVCEVEVGGSLQLSLLFPTSGKHDFQANSWTAREGTVCVTDTFILFSNTVFLLQNAIKNNKKNMKKMKKIK